MERIGSDKTRAHRPAKKKKVKKALKSRDGSVRDVLVEGGKKSILDKSAHGSHFYPKKREGILERYVVPVLETGGRVAQTTLDIASGDMAKKLQTELAKIQAQVDEVQGDINRLLRASRSISKRPLRRKKKQLYQKEAYLKIRMLLLNAKLDKLYGEGSRPKYRSYGLSGLNATLSQAKNLDIQLAPVMVSTASMVTQKFVSVGINAVFLPSSVAKFLSGCYRKQLIVAMKKKYSEDKELMGVLKFLENKHFVYTDMVGLAGSMAGFSFGAQEIGSWFGLNKDLLSGMGKMEKWTKTGVVTGVAGLAYKKGYDLYLMRNSGYWKNILEQTDPGFKGEKSKDFLKLEATVSERFDEELSDDELREIIRSKAVLGLLESDRGAVAYTLFMRLKKEGLKGQASMLLQDLGLSKEVVSFLNKMDPEDPEHVELASDLMIEVFKM